MCHVQVGWPGQQQYGYQVSENWLESGSLEIHWLKELQQWLMERKDYHETKIIPGENLEYVSL